jgi:hypothetical protein
VTELDRAVIFRALAEFQGAVPGQMTRDEARRIGVATSAILNASPNVTPEEVARRGENYRRRYPHVETPTAMALQSRWSECDAAPAHRRLDAAQALATRAMEESRG